MREELGRFRADQLQEQRKTLFLSVATPQEISLSLSLFLSDSLALFLYDFCLSPFSLALEEEERKRATRVISGL